MAIIYSYPVSTPKLDDLLIGTSIFDENDLTSQRGNPTVSFSLQSIVDLVATITGAQDLQQVTNVGATTTNTVTVSNLIVSGTIDAVGPIEDSTGSVGSTGQFLESTTTGTRWTTNSSNNYSWIVRDSQIVSVNKTLSGGQFLKLTTIYGSSTPDVTTLTGAGSALDPYLMTIPDTNYWTLRDDYTAGSVGLNKDSLVNNNTIPVLTNGGSGYPPGTYIFSVEVSSDSMKLNVYVGADGVIKSLTIAELGPPKYVDGQTFLITNGFPSVGTGGIVTLNVIGRQGILVQTTPLTLYPFTSGNTDAVQTAVFDGYGNNQQNSNNGVLGNLESSCDATRNQYANTLTLRATINPTAVQEIEPSDPLNVSGWTIPSNSNKTATTSNGSGVNLLIRFYLRYVNGLLVSSATIDWPGQGYQDGEIVTLVGGNNLTKYIVTTNGGATQINTGPEMKFFGQRGGYGLTQYINGIPNQRNTTFAKMASIKASAEQDFDSLVDKATNPGSTDILQRSPSSLIFSTARFTSTSATTGSTSMTAALRLFSTGQAQLYLYGDGNFTGTPTFNLSTTSSGYVIETPLYTWIARDSGDADKTLSVGQYLKFETAVGTPGATTLSGTGTTASPYLMTITSPDTNYTAGTGLTLNTLEFDANVDATVQTVQPVAVTATTLRTYAVQVDDTNDNLVVNVPWVAGGGGYVLPVATVAALGGVRLFNDTVNDVAPETITTTANRNYVVELSTDHKMLVNVPWVDTPYTLPVTTSSALGGIKIGYTDTGKNYAVELDADNEAYVNVPWTDTTYVLPLAADGTRGGVQIGYTQTATRDYPVTLDAEKMLVTVPWTDTDTNTTYDYLAVGSIPSGTVNSPPMGAGYSSAINVATTGGSGTGMTVDTTVVSGGVQTVTINNPGTGYAIGDNNIVISGGDSQAIMSLSGTVGETNPNLRLVDSAFAFDDVKLTGSGGTTITRTSDTGITISSTGGVTGSGTLNTVPRWTATGSDLGDGPIVFANNLSDSISTFGGDIYINSSGNGEIHLGPQSSGGTQATSEITSNHNLGISYGKQTTTAANFYISNNNTTQLTIQGSTGKVVFNEYGSGTITGTAAYNLSVDTSGNIIETANGGDITGSGADTQITIWDSATSITGNSNYTRDASNNISQGADTDVKNTIGRAVIDGGTINSDFAIFTHIDRVGSLDYAFMVSPNGSSYINAAGAGQTVQILDDNSSVANFSNGLIQLGAINVELSQYGSGNVTGTPTYNLSVDSTGKIIETANSSGGGGLVSKIATNSFNATQLQTGGTLSFQLPSSVPVGKQLLIQDCVFYLDAGTVSFNYGTGVGSIIELKFNDGSTFSQSLVLASTQSFMNGANDNMQQGSQPNVFFPILYGDIVTTGGGTMQIVLPSVSGIAPTQGNGELYCSIKYIEIDTGINFGL